jgi:dolichyl-phosphate beta-glucosyltransferase
MKPLLTIVIATYNEEHRLPATLERMFTSLAGQAFDFEILIVDDGSRDGTVDYVRKLADSRPGVLLRTRSPNGGRGAAIREGVLAARGALVLETDADGSVDDEAIIRFVRFFEEHPELHALFGSREMSGARIVQHQPLPRILLGYGFLFLSRAVLRSPRTTDFTLGFKMFRREAAQDIFRHQFDDQFVAEAEIVHVARLRGWRTHELPVTWTNNRDSRVHAVRDSVRSLRGVGALLARELEGRYK